MIEPFESEGLWEDPIVAEVRAARERRFAEAGFSLEKLRQMLREAQVSSGHEVVTLPPRRPGNDRH